MKILLISIGLLAVSIQASPFLEDAIIADGDSFKQGTGGTPPSMSNALANLQSTLTTLSSNVPVFSQFVAQVNSLINSLSNSNTQVQSLLTNWATNVTSMFNGIRGSQSLHGNKPFNPFGPTPQGPTSVTIIDVTDPNNPVHLDKLPGSRDFNSAGNYHHPYSAYQRRPAYPSYYRPYPYYQPSPYPYYHAQYPADHSYFRQPAHDPVEKNLEQLVQALKSANDQRERPSFRPAYDPMEEGLEHLVHSLKTANDQRERPSFRPAYDPAEDDLEQLVQALKSSNDQREGVQQDPMEENLEQLVQSLKKANDEKQATFRDPNQEQPALDESEENLKSLVHLLKQANDEREQAEQQAAFREQDDDSEALKQLLQLLKNANDQRERDELMASSDDPEGRGLMSSISSGAQAVRSNVKSIIKSIHSNLPTMTYKTLLVPTLGSK